MSDTYPRSGMVPVDVLVMLEAGPTGAHSVDAAIMNQAARELRNLRNYKADRELDDEQPDRR